jgi:hypothetical protein
MKTTDIGFESFEEDFYADINTMYIKPKEEDSKNYIQIVKSSNKRRELREEFLKRKKPLIMAAWERYCRGDK